MTEYTQNPDASHEPPGDEFVEVVVLDAGDVAPEGFEIEASHSEIAVSDASKEIAEVVKGRRGVARGYVLRLRRSHPEATPAELILLAEKQYKAAIATTSAAIAVGGVALEIAVGLLPGGGAASAAGKTASKVAAKRALAHTAKAASKKVAMNVATQAASVALPKGDEAAQFEITTLFALALAEIHGLEYDQDQAKALVYGLTSGALDDSTKALVARRAANVLALTDDAPKGRNISDQWARTLAVALPGEKSNAFVNGLQTAGLDSIREQLGSNAQRGADMGLEALLAGSARFVFGRQVVEAAREAFGAAPGEFPAALHMAAAAEETPSKPDRALAVLEEAAQKTGNKLAAGGQSIGSGVSKTADTISRPFRRVDLDGDGIVDDPQALAAARNAGQAVASAASALGGRIKNPFRGLGKRGTDPDPASAADRQPNTEAETPDEDE